MSTGGRVLIVGESWNAPHLVGRFRRVEDPTRHSEACIADHAIGWCAPYAMRASAFKYGRSRDFMVKLGLNWSHAVNLLPPLEAWDEAWASDMARAILTTYGAAEVVLLGRRVHRAFNPAYGTMDYFTRTTFEHGEHKWEVNLWPHPSGMCRLWNDPAIKVHAEMEAERLSGLMSSSVPVTGEES